MLNKLKDKLKSKFVVLSIASLIFLALTNLGVIDLEKQKALKLTAESVLSLLVVLGVLNNPDQEKF